MKRQKNFMMLQRDHRFTVSNILMKREFRIFDFITTFREGFEVNKGKIIYFSIYKNLSIYFKSSLTNLSQLFG